MSEAFTVELAASSFTEVFVEQLISTMKIVPSHHAGGLSTEGLLSVLQSQIGVASRSSRDVVACLTQMQLVSELDGITGRSRSGDKLRRDIRVNGSHSLAISIIRSGLMADQIRALRAILRMGGAGYQCGRSAAQSLAPQLVGLLARMPDVTISSYINIGRQSGLELDSVWNELPLTSRFNWQDANKRRKALGDRAELYSLQLECSSYVGARDLIAWVSRDSDSFGYDIEVRSAPVRRIEVKGSAGKEVQFHLSTNEYDVAQLHGANYEIQFWGDIRMQSDPVEEFERLIKAGYPVRISDPVSTLSAPPWVIKPSQYQVSLDLSPQH
jgi:hypothetical protein